MNETTSIETATRLYEQYLTTQHMRSDLVQQLHAWMKTYRGVLNASDYVHILYMEGRYYEENGNKNAARYCAMRMLAIKECYRYPRRKRSRMLHFLPYEFHEDEDAFLNEYTDFIQNVYKSIYKKLYVLTVGLLLVVFCIVTFLLHVSPLFAFIEASLLGLINFFIQKRKLPIMFQKNQTDASGKHIEEVLRDFDATYRFI